MLMTWTTERDPKGIIVKTEPTSSGLDASDRVFTEKDFAETVVKVV